jgi:hypothetical protein
MANRIRIKIGTVEFEAEGDEALIERERERFFGVLPQVSSLIASATDKPLQPPPPSPEGGPERAPAQTGTTVALVNVPPSYESLASMLNEKKFSTDVELVMGVAYYLYRVEGIDPFTAKDIEKELNNARRPLPGNISQCLVQNIKKSLLRESPGKKDGLKAYSVLESGSRWFESYLPTKAEQKKSSLSKAPRVAKDSPLLSISVDDLHIGNYCEVSRLGKFGEQVLVVMFIYMKERQIEYFSFGDIVAVFKEKFKLHATERQVRYVLDKGDTMFDRKTEGHITLHRLMSRGMQEAERIVAQQRNTSALPDAAPAATELKTGES